MTRGSLTLIAGASLLLLACSTAPSGGRAVPSASLVGPTWKWEGVVTQTEAMNVSEPERYTIQFLPDGRAAIRADCNRGTGAYKTEGTQLSFGPIASTRAMCPPGSLSDRFLESLQNAATFRIDRDRLYVDQKMDSGTLRLVGGK